MPNPYYPYSYDPYGNPYAYQPDGQYPWYLGQQAIGNPRIRSIQLVTDATTEPVTLDEAKQHERIDTDDDDSLVTAFITVARKMAEEYTGRALNTQTWQMVLDYAPPVFYLFRPILQSVTSVVTYDDDLTTTTIDSGVYNIDTVTEPGRIYLNVGEVWGYYKSPAGFVVTYVSGYGDDASDVPYPIREAILQIIGHLYENRESQMMPPLAMNLLKPYRIFYL